jgi:hypothetical protein
MGYGLLRVIKNCGKLPDKYTHRITLILAQPKMSVKETDLGGGDLKKTASTGQLVD